MLGVFLLGLAIAIGISFVSPGSKGSVRGIVQLGSTLQIQAGSHDTRNDGVSPSGEPVIAEVMNPKSAASLISVGMAPMILARTGQGNWSFEVSGRSPMVVIEGSGPGGSVPDIMKIVEEIFSGLKSEIDLVVAQQRAAIEVSAPTAEKSMQLVQAFDEIIELRPVFRVMEISSNPALERGLITQVSWVVVGGVVSFAMSIIATLCLELIVQGRRRSQVSQAA